MNVDGDPVRSYDIGIREEDPIITEGVYPPEQHSDTEIASFRWLGESTERAVIHFDSLEEPLGHVRLRGRPITNEIEAAVRFNGDGMGQIAVDDSLTDYNIPLNSS